MKNSQKNKGPLGQYLYKVLLHKIIEGELKAREQLPSERMLSEEYGVHRGVVREALKRLEAQKLVETRRGGGTRILDFHETGGLDLLEAMAINSEGLPNFSTIKDIVEWREDLGVTMTRRATLRCGEVLAERLDVVIKKMRDTEKEDLARLQELSLCYWYEIADATNNLAYRLALNSFKTVYDPFKIMLLPLMKSSLQDIQKYQDVANEIRGGDGDKAGILARSLVNMDGEKVLNKMHKKVSR